MTTAEAVSTITDLAKAHGLVVKVWQEADVLAYLQDRPGWAQLNESARQHVLDRAMGSSWLQKLTTHTGDDWLIIAAAAEDALDGMCES